MTEEEFKKAVTIVGNINGLRAQIATIEECDKLEKAMLKAGYEWDKQRN